MGEEHPLLQPDVSSPLLWHHTFQQRQTHTFTATDFENPGPIGLQSTPPCSGRHREAREGHEVSGDSLFQADAQEGAGTVSDVGLSS